MYMQVMIMFRWSPLMYKKSCHQHTNPLIVRQWCERITLNQAHNYTSTCTSRTSHYIVHELCVPHYNRCTYVNKCQSMRIKQFPKIQCIYINPKDMCTLHACTWTLTREKRSEWKEAMVSASAPSGG